jgi:serine protease Do
VKKLLVTTTMLTALVSPVNALPGADQWSKSGGYWVVGYNSVIGAGVCVAQAYYPKSETKIWFASALEAAETKDSWHFSLYNPRWKLQDGATYAYRIMSSKGSTVWEVRFLAMKHDDGKVFLNSKITKDFANALAFDGKGSFTIYPMDSNKSLAGFNIDHSAVAIRDVVHCRNDMLSQRQTTTATAPSQPSPSKPKDSEKSFGTGFYVSDKMVLTNWHVIDGCSKYINIKYPGYAPSKAWLKGSDKANDLAVLEVERSGLGVASFEHTARLGSTVYSFGFPLIEILSQSGNFVTGSISSLKGTGEDSRFLQTSAPVQSGNSGGPLLNASGAVIGVVQSKLNAIKTAVVTGDVPQNVNFAIKSMITVNFLQSSGVAPIMATPAAIWDPADIADAAQKYTVQVSCE